LAKLLLFLACLIVPGIWGLIVGSVFTRQVPSRWRAAPTFSEKKEDTDALAADIWDYQI